VHSSQPLHFDTSPQLVSSSFVTVSFVTATEDGHFDTGTAMLEIDVTQAMACIVRSSGSTRSALKVVLRVIAALCSKASDTELIVYYTGHSQYGSWLLPSQDQHPEVLAPVELMSMLAHQQTPVTVISDCCWSGEWCRQEPHTPMQLRVLAASHKGRSYIGELLAQIATGVVPSKQSPVRRLLQYSYQSVLSLW